LSTTLNAAFYSLSYDVLNDFAPLALLAAAAGVVFARKTLPANDLIVWLKAQSNQSINGNWRHHFSSRCRVVPEGNGHAVHPGALLGECGHAGPGGRPNRPRIHDLGSARIDAGRDRESAGRDK
jgi:hypothetical protein